MLNFFYKKTLNCLKIFNSYFSLQLIFFPNFFFIFFIFIFSTIFLMVF